MDDVRPATPAKTGVRRVNNVPLLIIGGVLLIFVVLVALVAAQRGKRPAAETPAVAEALPENTQAIDQMLAGMGTGGLVPATGEDASPSYSVARVVDPEVPPMPERVGGATSGVVPVSVANDRPDQKRRMQLFQEALRAHTGMAARPSTPPSPGPDAGSKGTPAGKQRENEAAAAAEPPERDLRVPVHANGDYAAFDGSESRDAGADRWLLGATTEAPRTTFELRAGSIIPALMISGINSELPGQIIAQVSQDVFDTATGRYRLVPQGSRLVGRYNHEVIAGQSRVLVAWQRIVFPDGKALDIGAMEGVDPAGYAGFRDKVDRHYMRMFGSAILMSGITAGLTSSAVSPGSDPYGMSASVQLREGIAQQIGDVASKMITKNMDLAPELKIRPGYRFNVMAVKDLTFSKAYKPFDY